MATVVAVGATTSAAAAKSAVVVIASLPETMEELLVVVALALSHHENFLDLEHSGLLHASVPLSLAAAPLPFPSTTHRSSQK